MQLVVWVALFRFDTSGVGRIWTFLNGIASFSIWGCQSDSGHIWHSKSSINIRSSGAGLANFAVLAYPSSNINKLSNSAVYNSSMYRIYLALWACFSMFACQMVSGFPFIIQSFLITSLNIQDWIFELMCVLFSIIVYKKTVFQSNLLNVLYMSFVQKELV